MKNKTNQHLHIDLYNGKSKWISESIFMNYTVGTNFDGNDSKGYYMTYKLEDGTVDKEYYNWKENWNRIKRCETHTVYMGEECILIDFTNKKLRGNK